VAYQVPPLPYDYSALEPYIDAQTMTLHHDKHHGAYVSNLNAAIEKNPCTLPAGLQPSLCASGPAPAKSAV